MAAASESFADELRRVAEAAQAGARTTTRTHTAAVTSRLMERIKARAREVAAAGGLELDEDFNLYTIIRDLGMEGNVPLDHTEMDKEILAWLQMLGLGSRPTTAAAASTVSTTTSERRGRVAARPRSKRPPNAHPRVCA